MKGTSFTGLLQLAFIILKLCKVINWSWFLVLLPTIIPIIIGAILLIVILLFGE